MKMIILIAAVLVLICRTGLPREVAFNNLAVKDGAGAIDQAAARLLLVVIKPTIYDYGLWKTAEWSSLTLVCLPFGKWVKL